MITMSRFWLHVFLLKKHIRLMMIVYLVEELKAGNETMKKDNEHTGENPNSKEQQDFNEELKQAEEIM